MAKRSLVAPKEIEALSFRIIAETLQEFDQSSPDWSIVQRIVHTTGDVGLASLVRLHPRAVEAATAALRGGCPIIVDVKMVAAGISRGFSSRFGCDIFCAIDDPIVRGMARDQQITRSEAAIRYLAPRLSGSVVAIGNAPTALFALLDYVDSGEPPPALIVGTPVGFVGAAESKRQLVECADGLVPYVTVEGTRGGSAIAAAAVNALLRLA